MLLMLLYNFCCSNLMTIVPPLVPSTVSWKTCISFGIPTARSGCQVLTETQFFRTARGFGFTLPLQVRFPFSIIHNSKLTWWLALILYEYLITFDEEVQYIWKTRITLIAVLLLSVRWVMVLLAIFYAAPISPVLVRHIDIYVFM